MIRTKIEHPFLNWIEKNNNSFTRYLNRLNDGFLTPSYVTLKVRDEKALAKVHIVLNEAPHGICFNHIILPWGNRHFGDIKEKLIEYGYREGDESTFKYVTVIPSEEFDLIEFKEIYENYLKFIVQ